MRLVIHLNRIFLVILVFLAGTVVSQAQSVNIDQLSDQQLQQYMSQAQLSGLSDAELEAKARQRGLSDDQIAKLKQRMQGLSTGSQGKMAGGNLADTNNTRNPLSFKNTKRNIEPAKRNEPKVYGADLFSGENLTFEPNLQLPTPRNYLIGTGDQLVLDLFGYSETNFKLKVSPEGQIRIPNIGPVKVAGLSIEDAEKKIKGQLIKIYPQIVTGKTSFQLSLGQIRSIRVTLIGEVQRPGTYTLPSLATLANALYVSGGPTINGAFRAIDLVRNGKTLVRFDLYDFLQKGDLTKNLLLQDDDIVKINAYQKRIQLKGAVKRPMLYEVKEGESLEDVLFKFAGGLTDSAYREQIKLVRVGKSEKEIIDIPFDSIAHVAMQTGDVYTVDGILDRFTNRVTITGALLHPGEYSLNSFPTLHALLDKAGLKEEAYMKRAVIRRLQSDYTPSMLNFNITDVINGKADIRLQREDIVTIYSLFDVREAYNVSINGEVNKPGTYEFSDSMRLQDLVLVAGGFTNGASGKKIEIARRLANTGRSIEGDTSVYAIVQEIALNRSIESEQQLQQVLLEPYDVVSVRKNPAYKEQVKATVEGEVLYPGEFVIEKKQERLSELVQRAGGLKEGAYPAGAILIRNKESITKTRFIEQERKSLIAASDSVINKDSLLSNVNLNSGTVGIDLNKALAQPGSSYDIYLEEGDILSIPKKLQTVKTFGGIYLPKQIVYNTTRFKEYINQSGGFVPNSNRNRSFVIYANGHIHRTHHFLFLKSYPKVEPGSEVYVPVSKGNRKLSAQELAAIGSTIAGLASALITIIYVSKL
ncbi:MAG: SLBB domain-containing protein [Bacteroidota bacterium]|nr:SLBB domain-containing protein [Bacteroidota bacterium]